MVECACVLKWARSIFHVRLGGRPRPANRAVTGQATVARWSSATSRSESLKEHDEYSTININDILDIQFQGTKPDAARISSQ
jgi:hypothetical protein